MVDRPREERAFSAPRTGAERPNVPPTRAEPILSQSGGHGLRVPVSRPPQQPVLPPRSEIANPAAPFRIRQGSGWLLQIPARIVAVTVILTAPLRAVVWILDAAVAAAMVGVLVVLGAWWTHQIPDEAVAMFLGQLGARGLSILLKSGAL